MAFAKVFSAQTLYLDATIISVEVDLSKGLHSFTVVGLPDKAVEESRDRIGAAIKNSGFASPKSKNQKVVVSLAPADVKKEGPNFDLAMALSYLLASEDIKFSPDKKLFLGELSLDGNLRPIRGTLALVRQAQLSGFTEIFLPRENAAEAALLDGVRVYGAETLRAVIGHLDEKQGDKRSLLAAEARRAIEPQRAESRHGFEDIRGQEAAKRGLEIAAAGGHNIALSGPPGTGKTMLARAFAGILPPLSFEETLEATSIHSIAGTLRQTLLEEPPFRAPHHTSSYIAIVGGGPTPKPGEITLAHRGVLFLDEFPEFDRRVIETLREPLEERIIRISRSRGSAYFPANFILIAAMNPCPCGNWGVKGKICTCLPYALAKYQRKISGPIIDRIDMWLEVASLDHEKLSAANPAAEKSEEIRKRVLRVREIQKTRFAGRPHRTNAEMSVRDIGSFAALDEATKKILNASAKKLDLSARAYHRVLKLARTIADMGESEKIRANHILEALQYRPKQTRS